MRQCIEYLDLKTVRRGKIARPKGGTVAFSSGLIKRATKPVESLQKRLFQAISEGKFNLEASMKNQLKLLKLTKNIVDTGHST